jgi:hypothetical protein
VTRNELISWWNHVREAQEGIATAERAVLNARLIHGSYDETLEARARDALGCLMTAMKTPREFAHELLELADGDAGPAAVNRLTNAIEKRDRVTIFESTLAAAIPEDEATTVEAVALAVGDELQALPLVICERVARAAIRAINKMRTK